jgi:hypothetical protein
MQRIFGAGLIAYALLGLATGLVHAPSGWRMREVHRLSRPRRFYAWIGAYAGVGAVLLVLP